MAKQNNTLISIWHNNLSRDFDSHWHPALEIIMPLENWYEAIIEDKPYHTVPGDILIIPPKAVHSLKAPETGKRLIFLFDLTGFARLKGFSGIQNILSTPLLLNRGNHPGIYEEACRLLTQMDQEYTGQREFAELAIIAHLLNLFVLLGVNRTDSPELSPNTRVYKQKEYTEKFNTVIEYIDNHYMEEIDMERIAKSIGFSKYHFSRLFKQFTHHTFSAYVNRRRILAAEELLRQPDLTVMEIALQSGFPSIATFNRVFKQQNNCTPSKYREKNSYFRGYR